MDTTHTIECDVPALPASPAESHLAFTILFSDPYWIGLLELTTDGTLGVARHIFGGEPTAPEVALFVERHFNNLLNEASASTVPLADATGLLSTLRNPKRALRDATRAVAASGIASKAQEALRLQIEARKQERRVRSRAERDTEDARRHAIARDKARERHRGH